jgi:signal transduction histidine kinase
MLVIDFVYGLAFFGLGMAILCEIRQPSDFPLDRQFPWLAVFGLVQSVIGWIDMFLQTQLPPSPNEVLLVIRTALLPVSGLLLMRFGVGLLRELKPLLDRGLATPVALIAPVVTVTVYGLVSGASGPQTVTSANVWSRYLLYFPGSLLTAWGFIRHGYSLPRTSRREARYPLLGAGVAFALYGIAAGLIVPKTPHGLASWLNYDAVYNITHLPVQLWQTLIALAVLILILWALDAVAAGRRDELEALHIEREQAQAKALIAQRDARLVAEKWIEELVQISQQIATLDPLDVVLARIVGCAHVFLGADAAALALWDENYAHLIVKAYAGTAQKAALGMAVRTKAVLEAARARRAEVLPQDYDQYCELIDARIRSGVVAPLAFEDELLGALWAVSGSAGAFDCTKLARLGHLSDQAVIAIQHALMATRLQSLAATEERSRIAREMHDGLAQILGYLNLEMQTLESLVRQGQVAVVFEELAKARDRINAAQADVRENILSLRTTLAGETSLLPSLHEYIQEFSARTGIAAELVTTLDAAPPLSPMAETQLVRIVQEALANVRKHARATHVWTRMDVRGDCLHVTITDDGIGFESGIRHEKFGIQTMGERAEGVGGELAVTSHPGKGTQVTLWLPLMKR